MSRFHQTTKNNFGLFDVVSALQKEIRRGNEEGAMYWSMELIPQYEQYLWRRLSVIVNEDIGIASIETVLLVAHQRSLFFEFRSQKNGNGNARLVLATTLLAMCRAPKSRISDHFQAVIKDQRERDPLRQIPDYALDKHTGKGRSLGRGLDHWLQEGCKLFPLTRQFEDPYSERAKRVWADKTPVKRPDGWDVAKRKETDVEEDEDTQGSLFE